jgi:hypothetical protein
MVGLPLLFVPITTASYAGLPPEKTNQASALINVARNLGGSIGVRSASNSTNFGSPSISSPPRRNIGVGDFCRSAHPGCASPIATVFTTGGSRYPLSTNPLSRGSAQMGDL